MSVCTNYIGSMDLNAQACLTELLTKEGVALEEGERRMGYVPDTQAHMGVTSESNGVPSVESLASHHEGIWKLNEEEMEII